jgi:hypothetical protein
MLFLSQRENAGSSKLTSFAIATEVKKSRKMAVRCWKLEARGPRIGDLESHIYTYPRLRDFTYSHVIVSASPLLHVSVI